MKNKSARYAFYIFPCPTEQQSDKQELQENTFFTITDLPYFEKNGHASDWHLSALIHLPTSIKELGKGLFVSESNQRATKKLLKKLGVVEDRRFIDFNAQF